MKREFVLLRKVAIVIVASASIIGAVGLIWLLDLTSLSVLQMVAMLALCLLPGATYAAWQWDRKAAHHRVPPDADGLFETPEGIEFAPEPLPSKPQARDTTREATPGRPSADAAPPHRRRNHAVRRPAERD